MSRIRVLLAISVSMMAVVGSLSAETPEERIARLQKELLQAQEEVGQRPESAQSTTHDTKRDTNRGKTEIPVGALVIVEGPNGGGGSGFIAEIKGRTFFVTNIHVLAAARNASFKTVQGKPVGLSDRVFVSQNRDLAIVPIEWGEDRLQVSPSLTNDQVSIGDNITVMGNSDGASVATRLRGKIDGIGPDELEISAKFVPGNSGSPIVHDELGTVVGIVSYMKDLSQKDKWTQDSELSDIRRFGFRLDGEIQWQQLSLKDLYDEGERFARFEERTYYLAHIIYMLKDERKIMTGMISHDSLGHLFEPFEAGFSWERGLASANNVSKLEHFVSGLDRELSFDQSSTEKTLKTGYFQARYKTVNSVRDHFKNELKRVTF